MIKFRESELVSLYSNELQKVHINGKIEYVEAAFDINFMAQAKYLKERLPQDKSKAVLIVNFVKTGQAMYVILKKTTHGESDSNIPDSFELTYEFDESALKDADVKLTLNDPEFSATIFQVCSAKGMNINKGAHESLIISLPLEVLNMYINKCINEGTNVEIELENIFTLSVVNGENDSKVQILPGSIVKSVIKSDDVVAIEEN